MEKLHLNQLNLSHLTGITTLLPAHIKKKTSTRRPEDERDDVVVLTAKNLTLFVSANRFVVVNFYAPWCQWSQKLSPEYAAAVAALKAEGVVLAKVDCSAETEVGRVFKIRGYPTLLMFIGGVHNVVHYDPNLDRIRDAIASWVKLKLSPQLQIVTKTHEVGDIFATKSTIVLAFLDNLKDAVGKELDNIAKLHNDVDFYQTTDIDVAMKFHIFPLAKRPALVMLKWEDGRNHTHFVFDGEFTSFAISEFVSLYKLPSVITFTEENTSHIFENRMKKLWLFTPKFSWEVESTFKEAAKAFKGKLLFIHVKSDCKIVRQISRRFGILDDAPRVVAYMENSRKHIYHGELTLTGIKSLAFEVLEGKPLSHSNPYLKHGAQTSKGAFAN